MAWPCEKETNAGWAVRDTSVQAVSSSIPVSLVPVCDDTVESTSHHSGKCYDYATFREAEAARCDEVVDSTSHCGSLCSAYTCFCKDSL